MTVGDLLKVLGDGVEIELIDYDNVGARLGIFSDVNSIPHKYINCEVEFVKPYKIAQLTVAINYGEEDE